MSEKCIEVLQEAGKKYPLYMYAKRIGTDHPRWTIEVLGKGMSHSKYGAGGDAELVHTENESLLQAMIKAGELLAEKVKLLDSGSGWGSFGID